MIAASGGALSVGRGTLQWVGDKGRAVSLVLCQGKAQRRASDLAPIVAEVRADGAASLLKSAAALNTRRIPTIRAVFGAPSG